MVTLALDFFARFTYTMGTAIVNGHISGSIPHHIPIYRPNQIPQAKTTESK